MQSFSKSSRLASRAPRAHLFLRLSAQPLRFAHGTYGNDQSGQEKAEDAKNPKEHLEHPGPEAPASKDSSSSSQPSGKGSSGGGKAGPKIHHPPSAAEKDDPEVRAHNEDMRNRSEQSVNQLGEGDNKVNPKFWKGDPGKSKD